MTPDDLKWPAVYTDGVVVHYSPTEDFSSAYVGGPLEQAFSGVAFGPEPLHRIFTFSPAGLPQPTGHNLQGRMSLFYGMRFSGCELRYRVAVFAGVGAQYIQDYAEATQVMEMTPTVSSEDWPYTGYPLLLPYVPLREASRVAMEPEAFAESYTWQGLEELSHDELVVVVPAIARLGVSMWGRSGDDEAVQLVFRYSYASQEIHAFNQCT
ncbi:hypothetical protein OB934_22875 [Aeromonas salmonicida]|uniref:hypothetical protein n=1 Tax=Aeromonas salmonicida TaxID=645 RepID=UPI00259E4A5C|nr:hypothetical protein [Aeromonas salmonicida]MDM5065600.1 hypothetical protein [Aeromonas salmonicida]